MELTITELSNLTKKTRPTIYKYRSCFDQGKLDDVPYSFIKLFELMDKKDTTKKEIIDFCHDNFVEIGSSKELQDIMNLIKENQSDVSYEDIEKLIKEKSKHGK